MRPPAIAARTGKFIAWVAIDGGTVDGGTVDEGGSDGVGVLVVKGGVKTARQQGEMVVVVPAESTAVIFIK